MIGRAPTMFQKNSRVDPLEFCESLKYWVDVLIKRNLFRWRQAQVVYCYLMRNVIHRYKASDTGRIIRGSHYNPGGSNLNLAAIDTHLSRYGTVSIVIVPLFIVEASDRFV